MIRLNLGSGGKPMSGYVNIDCAEFPGADLYHDLRMRLPYPDGTVDEIIAKHVAEHFGVTEWPGILADWVRVLAPGGRLIIEAPDLQRLCENYLGNKHGLRELWHQCIYGKDGPGMRHAQGFTIPRLRQELTAAGLRVVRARNWHDDHPDHIDVPAWHYNLRVEAVKA